MRFREAPEPALSVLTARSACSLPSLARRYGYILPTLYNSKVVRFPLADGNFEDASQVEMLDLSLVPGHNSSNGLLHKFVGGFTGANVRSKLRKTPANLE